MKNTPSLSRYRNRYGIQNYISAREQMQQDAVLGFDYSVPSVARDIYSKQNTFRNALSYAKSIYMDNEDDDYDSRVGLADFITTVYPEMSFGEAMEFGEELMYRATGYRDNTKNWLEHMWNTFYSNASSMAAGMDLAATYIGGLFTGFDEDFRQRRQQKLDEINTRYAMYYNTDNRFNDSLFENVFTSTAALAPSTLLSMGLSVAAGGATKLTGGVVSATLKNAIKTASKRSLAGNIFTFSGIAARYSATGMIEMGNSLLQMKNLGIDDDVAFGLSAVVGIANGVLETIGDPFVENMMKPFTSLMNKEGRKIVSTSFKDAMFNFAKRRVKKTGENILSEVPTEVLQELSSMIGYNIAIGIENSRGKTLDGARKYTAKDFKDAIYETAIQTLQGTVGFSLIGGALDLAGEYTGGDIKAALDSSQYFAPKGAERNVSSTTILTHERDINVSESDFASSKAEPINVVRIGNRYIAVNPTDKQMYAIKNSQNSYIKSVDLSSEKAVGHSVSADNSASFSPMTADTVLATIEKGIYHNEIAGFTFYDENMSPTTDMSSAAYASIVSSADTTTPVLIRLTTDNDSASADSLETTLFGRILAKPEWSTQSVKDIRNREKQRKKEAKKTKNKRNETKTENTQQSTEQNTETLSVSQDPDVSTETEVDDGIQDATYQDVSPEDMEMIEDIVSEIERRADEELSSFADEEVSSTGNGEETSDIGPNTAETTSSPTENAEIDTDDDNVITEADIPNPEQIQRNTEREQRVAEFRQTQEEWENTKKNLTGKDINNDIDVLSDRFENVLAKTKVGEKPELLKASARSSAMIMTGFMRASGMTGKEYYDSLKGFLTGGKVPYVGEDGKIYFQAAYHGTGADFDRFSTDHIGEGEGAQFFGWGLYFSMKEGVARGYAETAVNNRENPYDEHIYRLSKILNKYNPGYINAFGSLGRQELIDRINREINNINLNISVNEITINSKLASEDERNYAEIRIPQYKAELEELNLLIKDVESTQDNQKNLYTVEIPDGPYIKWYEPADENVQSILSNDKELRKAYENINAGNENFSKIESIFDWEDFGDIYKELSEVYEQYHPDKRGDEYISKLLNKHGYAGITYPVGTVRGGYNPNSTAMNYVIFNEDDVKIVDHIYFQQQSGEKIGWFMSDEQMDRYIGILENADPTTLSHELGHHFLSVLAPDNPYYQRIASTYREQFEADGGVFGTNLQEAFCTDLENYIKGRQSSNKEMNDIFEKIYQIAKSMWASFKDFLNLSPEKKELFDSIFGEKTEEAVSENIQKADMKADKTENPSVTLANDIVPESAEAITEEKINESVDNLYNKIDEKTESVVTESPTAYIQDEPENRGQKLAEFVSPENIVSDETGAGSEYWTYEDYVPEGLDYMFDIREKGYPENEDTDAEAKRNAYFDIKDKNNAKNLDLTINGERATEANILEDRANEIANTDMYIFGWSAKKREGQDFISVNRKPNLTSIVKKNAVYKYISKITGIDGIDGSFAEIYLDDNQSIFVKMKNEIRYNDDKDEYYLVPMNEPRWLYIPFNEEFTEETRAGISMEDNMAELGLLDDFDKIKSEGKNYSPFMIAAAYLSDYAKWTERRADKANFEDQRKRSKSLPKQKLFYSTTENPETNSENIIDSVARITLEGLKDSKVRTIYSKFYERVLKATENASKEFEVDYQKDIKEHSDNQEYIAEMEKNKQDSLLSAQNYAIAQEFGVESFSDINSLFEQYLMQDEDIKNAISAYGENSSDVLKRIADYLKFTGNSYTTTSQILSTALRNPSKYRKNGIRLINRMLLGWRAASKLTKEGKPTYMSEAFQFSKSFFGADSKVNKIFMKIRELGTYDDVDKSMESMKESITDEEWDMFFKALVNPEYKIPNGLTNDKKTGRLTSPLMVLSNYLEGYREGNPRTADSFEYAGEDFTSYSHDMLVSRIDEINQERREKGLEPLKIEDYFEKDRNIIRDLTMTLAAAGGTMKDLFNDKTTKGTVDAIKNAIDRKIESLNEEISKLRKSANTGDAKALNDEIAKLNREKARLENRIKTLEKSRDNSKQALKDYKYSTRNELNDAKKKARNLEKQIEQKQKELDNINIKLNTKIDKLNAKIDALRNSNEYYQTKELERKYVAAFEHIDNLASSGNQRLAISLKRIVDFMKNYRETVVPDDLFTSKYEEYNPILTYVRDSLINAGIIVERDNETVINKPLHQESPDNNKRKKKGIITGVYGMTIKELARFTSIIRNARKIGLDISKEEKQERGEFYSDLENGSIRSIPMFEEMSDAEVDSEIQNLRDSTVVGSATDEYNRNSRISGVINNFRLVEPFMKRKFPVLHAFIFGGDLANGKYNENNLNAANNRRAKESLDRKEKLTSEFRKLFGDKLNFEIDSRKIFVKNKVVLGNISATDFAKKRGFSWGQVLEDGTVDVSDYIKRNIKYKSIAEEILRTYDNYKKARDNAYMMLTGLELEETLANLKTDFDKKMNGVKADEFTIDQLMGIYIYARQKGGLRRLINNKIIDGKRTGNSIPLGKVLWVVDQFENNPEYAKYREFADYLQKEIASKYEDVAQVYYNITSNILSQEDYYFGLVSEDSEVLNALELIKDESDVSNAKRINYNVADWFTKDRNHGTSALNLHVVDIASRAIDAQEKYIHLAEPLNMLRKLFEKEGRFEAALISAYGAKKGVQINKLFYDWVERQMSNPVISDNAFTNVISMLRRNKTISLLTLNATTILNNFPTVLLAGNEYGIKNTITGLTRYLADKKENDAFVYEKSPQMRERARLELAEFKADLRRLTEKGSIAEQIEFLKEHGIDDKILASEDFIRRVNAKLLDWQNGFDRGVANAMWMISYETEMNKGIPEGIDDNTFSTMCAEKATQFVLSTNPSQNVKDNALIYASKEQWVKDFFLFTAQLNKQFNIFWNSAADLAENRNLEALGRFARTFMYLGVVSGLAAIIAGNHLKDDEDDDEWYDILGRLLSATGVEMVGMIPAVGTLARNALTGAVYYDSGIVGDFINLTKAIRKDPEDRREGQLGRAVMNAIGDIAEIAGIPFNGPGRKGYNVFFADDDVAVNFGEAFNSKWGDAYNRWVS